MTKKLVSKIFENIYTWRDGQVNDEQIPKTIWTFWDSHLNSELHFLTVIKYR